ncbi:uncharacterized protein LOC125819158 [Solanum verrucosum]|uniref:uncharacterized protein LOC125819158 n=1 Tax=Solanum verrucosum TaxID=315347 RepID=UPI0020D1640D|nr:uncharacterized protein LOC125819158 [Solanum verrucosum]
MFCRPSDHDHMKAKQNTNASTPKECCKIRFCGNVLQLTKSKETPKVLGLWDCYHIPSVTELYDAGVIFIRIGYVQEKKEDKTTLFDIKFEKDIGNDKQVASIFKKLSDGVEITSFYYIEECNKLIQHCDRPWSQMKASLRHNYFSSPWVGASTVAAVTLLVLTVIQIVLAFTGDVMKRSLL